VLDHEETKLDQSKDHDQHAAGDAVDKGMNDRLPFHVLLKN